MAAPAHLTDLFAVACDAAWRAGLAHRPAVQRHIRETLAREGDLQIGISTRDKKISVVLVHRDGERQLIASQVIASEEAEAEEG